MHKFVRNRIKNHADAALHVELPCNPAVNHIASRCKEKYAESNVKEREIVSYAGKSHKRDEHGYAQNAEISDDVGDCPNLFEIDLTEFFCHIHSPNTRTQACVCS